MLKTSSNINFFLQNPQQPPPARQLGITREQIVQNRIKCAKNMIAHGNYSNFQFLFTFLSKFETIGSFVLTLRKVCCPQNTFFYQLSLESVKRGPELEIISFMTAGPSLKDPKAGDQMFIVSLKEILIIFSEMRFTPDVFLRIAREIVPKEYVVVMHHECDEKIPELLFNPFSIRVDYFSFQTRPEKRVRSCVPRIEQFSSEPAVEVVEEGTNEKPPKKRRT